ncbi:MAG: T9SS type A sorting domain-containing protein [Aureispira sp.]
MRLLTILLLSILSNWAVYGQCAALGVSVSASDTSYVQLYQAGFFLIPSGIDNVCEWEVTTFSGVLVHRDTTSGSHNDQSTTLFNHTIPIADSMNLRLFITNVTTGITCTIEDTLFWEEIQVLPGAFIGNWNVLSNNTGKEDPLFVSTPNLQNLQKIAIYPTPTQNYFQLKTNQSIHQLTIVDLNSRVLTSLNALAPQQLTIDVSTYPSGVYFVQCWDTKQQLIASHKLIKF